VNTALGGVLGGSRTGAGGIGSGGSRTGGTSIGVGLGGTSGGGGGVGSGVIAACDAAACATANARRRSSPSSRPVLGRSNMGVSLGLAVLWREAASRAPVRA
jgi:hypothetical protein